jgi:hypothetical protein
MDIPHPEDPARTIGWGTWTVKNVSAVAGRREQEPLTGTRSSGVDQIPEKITAC